MTGSATVQTLSGSVFQVAGPACGVSIAHATVRATVVHTHYSPEPQRAGVEHTEQ